jgi:hypothetical protein
MAGDALFKLPERILTTYRVTTETAAGLAANGQAPAAEQLLCVALRHAEEAARDGVNWGESLVICYGQALADFRVRWAGELGE